MTAHVTTPAAALAQRLPEWVTLVRAAQSRADDARRHQHLGAAHAGDPAVVIDPGPLDERPPRAIAEHGPIGTVLVTHGHPDHVEGRRPVRRAHRRAVVATWASSPAGVRSPRWRRPGTPPTRSASWQPTTSGVFTGDTILGRGSSVVAWPDGDLGDYLDSLELLTAYSGRSRRCPATARRWPTAPSAAPVGYLAHRRARLDQVRQRRRAGREHARGGGRPRSTPTSTRALVGRRMDRAGTTRISRCASIRGIVDAGSQGLDGP